MSFAADSRPAFFQNVALYPRQKNAVVIMETAALIRRLSALQPAAETAAEMFELAAEIAEELVEKFPKRNFRCALYRGAKDA